MNRHFGVLTPLLKSRTTDDWLAVFGENGVSAGPVNIHRVFVGRRLFTVSMRTTPEKDGFSHPMVANPIRMPDTPLTLSAPAPRLGADTYQVLSDVLGMADSEFDQLEQKIIEMRG